MGGRAGHRPHLPDLLRPPGPLDPPATPAPGLRRGGHRAGADASAAERGAPAPRWTHLWQFDTGGAGPARQGRASTLPDDGGDQARRAARRTRTPSPPSSTPRAPPGRPRDACSPTATSSPRWTTTIELLHPVFKSVSKEPASTLLFLPLSPRLRPDGRRRLHARPRAARARAEHPDRGPARRPRRASGRPSSSAIPYVLEKVYNTGRATAEKMGRASSFDRAARIAQRYGEAVEEQDRPGLGPCAPGWAAAACTTRSSTGGSGPRWAAASGTSSAAAPRSGRRLAAFYTGAGIEVFEGYGLTETTGASTVTPPLRPRLGTVGWPLPGTAVRIADDGEVLLRGRHVFAGYWDTRARRPCRSRRRRLVRHRRHRRARRRRAT